MTKSDFSTLVKYTENKLKLTKDNVFDKSVEIVNAYTEYLNLYIKELKRYRELVIDKDRLYGTLYDDFRFNNNKALKSKTEIDPYIDSNKVFYDTKIAVMEQEMVVKYLEGILDNINRMSYNIKNFIELKQMKEGLK